MASKPPNLSLKDAGERELQKVFDQFDGDGDGKISPAELSGVLSATGSASSPADIRRAMEDIDSDKDGFISPAEFAAFCRSCSSSSSAEAEIRDAFDLYDRDRDGLISAEELHLVLNRLNARCSREDCARMIQSVDKDGDGNVNFEEFKRMMADSIPGNGGSVA
ncbi:probable calcium-binding protein CML27 [Syzygium oleosum]|uniref:probable calcium-binding protein CML27 n=1 Tax=Syzygium oleosum TaxID=219896 RepID=UPI0011D26ABF|nr:probable calcium-binding protein CML27 [Syzygium oleosum]